MGGEDEYLVGEGRWARRDLAEESGANPKALRDYSVAGLDRWAPLVEDIQALSSALANYRTSAAGASNDVPDLEWDVGKVDDGAYVEDALDDR